MATPKKTLLKQIGELLWGPNFIESMAEALGCTGKSVRRYLGGERDLPDDALPKLVKIMVRRRGELDEKISALGG